MGIKWRLVLSLGLGAVLLLPASFRAGAGSALADTSPQIAPVATFYAPDGVVGDGFGFSMALSADGSTALIGASHANEAGISNVGKAYIYTRSNGVWPTNPTAIFIDPALRPGDQFGGTVVLSADGATALLNGYEILYVYSRINGDWSSAPTVVLNDPDPNDGSALGDGFGGTAISADGDTILASAAYATVNGVSGAGKVYVFAQSNGSWSPTPMAVFTDPGAVTDESFGSIVALSADGTVALVGTASLWSPGRALIFTKVNGLWNTTPVATFDLPGNSSQIFGSGALSANGKVALIGSTGVDNSLGAVFVYTEQNGAWPTIPSVLFNAPPGQDMFGMGVTLSGNGAIAAVPDLNMYFYAQAGGSWLTNPVTVLSAEPPAANFCGGYEFQSVALSFDGSEALIGAPEMPWGTIQPPPPPGCVNNGAVGRAYIYASSDGWMNPSLAPSPTTNSNSSSGSGAIGWLSVILLVTLLTWSKYFRH